jgi:multidrug efflux pump
LSVSTITAHLKLNQDSRKALAEIASKVDQVRGDLPPDAQVPVINIESADSQFASCYLSFSSDILQQNEITDYLVRVVQPRLSALGGVQRADILGGRTFAMRIWLKPDRMAALNVSPVQGRQALAANNFLSAVGQTKGSLIQVNLTANTDLRSVPSSSSWSSARSTGRSSGWATSPTSCWAPKTTTPRFASRVRPPSSWACGSSRTRTRWT